jgi:hypothetical protein
VTRSLAAMEESQGKICPGTSQFNGGTSRLTSKRWDGRTTPLELAGTVHTVTPAGTVLGPQWMLRLQLWPGDSEGGATRPSPP